MSDLISRKALLEAYKDSKEIRTYDYDVARLITNAPAVEQDEQPQAVKDALEKAAVTTWSYLMDYCKKKGKNPAHDNDLFEVVNEIRALIEKE